MGLYFLIWYGGCNRIPCYEIEVI